MLDQLPEVPADAWWAADAPTAARLAGAVLRMDRLDMAGARDVLISALAIAAETVAADQRDDLLQRAAAFATWNGVFSSFPPASAAARSRLADLIEERGRVDIAAHLRGMADAISVAGTDALTRAEAAVVASALAGLSNTDIAAKQHVSVNTVKSQLRGAFRKLEVANRQELIDLFQFGRRVALGEHGAVSQVRPVASSGTTTAIPDT